MTDNSEINKRYFPIPKPLAEMTQEERKEYARELAEFILQNENLGTAELSNDGVALESIIPVRQSRMKNAMVTLRKPLSFANRVTKRSAGALAIIAVLLGGSAVYLGVGPYVNYKNTDPKTDGFVPPRSIETLVDLVSESTVTVFCDYSKDISSQGSGWAIEVPNSDSEKFLTSIITNHHVIEKCLENSSKVTIKLVGSEKMYESKIENWDAKNDLAIIATTAKIKPLKLSSWPPYPGYWVMAIGTADGYEGSVAFGNVLNLVGNDVLITANISHGNSGGPLVDNEGNVVGTNTSGAINEQYNIAVSLDAMCAKIIKCKTKDYWDWN